MHLARIFMDHLLVLMTCFVTFCMKFIAFYLLIVPMFASMLMCMFRPTVDFKIPLLRLPHPQTHTHPHTYKPVYKKTKIVRALWLAERRVCMRVCKHGCDVKVYWFSRANHASTNLKTLLSWKLDKFTHCPFPVRLKLVKSLQKCSVNFFRLSWHFKREKSLFLESIFLAKQELITIMIIIIIKYWLWHQ